MSLKEAGPKVSNIGDRRKPRSDTKPGYIHIDTVHQGDQDRQKGGLPYQRGDEVLQREVVCSVEKISERYPIPAQEQMLYTSKLALTCLN